MVIAAILVIGIGVTLTTSSFVERNRDSFHASLKEQPLGGDGGSGAGMPHTNGVDPRLADAGKGGRPAAPLPPNVAGNGATEKKTPDNGVSGNAAPKSGGKTLAPGHAAAGNGSSANLAPDSTAAGNTVSGEKNRTAGEDPVKGSEPVAGAGPAAERSANHPASIQQRSGRLAAPGGTRPDQPGQATTNGTDSAAPYSMAEGADGKQALSPVLSPLGPAGTNADSDTEEKKAYYHRLLTDLDTQIQSMRNDSSDSTTYSMKTMADKELKLWNVEMNMIYTDVMNAADDVTKAELESAQQDWMKDRDAKAESAAKKYSGGTLEGVEYTACLAESTRQRTYDLVEKYLGFLPSE